MTQPGPHRRWLVLGTAFAVLFFVGGSRNVFGLVLKPMAEDLGQSRSSLALAVTLFMFVSALAMPAVGRLADRYGPRWIIAAGAAVAALGIGLMWTASASWHVLVLYGVVYAVGVAAAGSTPVLVLVSRWWVHRMGIANSVAFAGTAVGQLVILAILSSVILTIEWRAAFGAVSVALAVVLVPLVLVGVRQEAPHAGDGGVRAPAGRAKTAAEGAPWGAAGEATGMLAARRFWLLGLMYACCGFQDFFVTTHVVAFATDQGVGTTLAGNILALMGLMGLLGVMASGVLSDSRGPSLPAGLCFAMRVVLFALVMVYATPAGAVLFALLFGFTFLITAPLSVVYAGDLFGPARLGIASGAITMVHQIAGGLGAYVGAAVFDRYGSYQWAFALMLALSLVALAASAALGRRQRAEVVDGPPVARQLV